MDSLEARLVEAEKLAGIERGEDYSKRPALAAMVETLQKKMTNVEEQNKGFKEFHAKYKKMEDLLRSDVDLKDLLVSTNKKEEIVLASSERLQHTGVLLEAMNNLKQSASKAPITNVAAVEADLTKAELAMNQCIREAAALHGDVNSFFESYDNLINLMSQNFLLWNSTLTQWEEKIANKN